MNAKDTIIAGRVRLLFGAVFFGSIAVHMRLVETKQVPTMGVDGVSLFFNPDFVAKLSKSEVEAVLAHEVLHIVLLTHLRRGGRDPKLWNVATDYAINLVLKAEKFDVGKDWLLNEKFTDWSAEKIYNYLQENPDEQPDGGEGWNVGSVMDAGTGGDEGKEGSQSPLSQSEVEVQVGRVKAQIQAAAMTAKKAGKFSAGMERMIEEVCAPRANWKVILQRFINEKVFSEWDYNRANTRMLDQYGIMSPVLGGEELGHTALIVDTSGSVDDKQLAQFGGEISDILDQYNCKITVIYCDTKINREPEEFTRDDLPLFLKAVGGGGTLMQEAVVWVMENIENPAALILYSDSYLGDWNEIPEPGCPMIMACSERNMSCGIPDFIEVVDISE